MFQTCFPFWLIFQKAERMLSKVLSMIQANPSAFLQEVNCTNPQLHFSEPALDLVNRILNYFGKPKQIITYLLDRKLTSHVNICFLQALSTPCPGLNEAFLWG